MSSKEKLLMDLMDLLETYNFCKISLSCFDEKIYVLDDGVNSLAYFHKDIKD